MVVAEAGNGGDGTMARKAKLLARARANPSDVRFSDLLTLVDAFGFGLDRQEGSHRVS